MTDHSERVLLPSDLTPKHYTLEITPNFTTFLFQVNETIQVTVHKAGVKTFTLHAKDIHIFSCKFQDNEATEINYNKKMNTVTFVFENEFIEGTHDVFIKYEGILNSDMAGFYRCKQTYST